ncbi:MAG TPA: DUF2975 domain-containing protein [Gammaproteobacteria bacterium]
MTTQRTDKLERVARYSRSLRQLFQLLLGATAIALLVGTLLIATGTDPYDTSVTVGGAIYVGDVIPAVLRSMAVVGFILSTGILLKVLFHLVKLFGLYAQGKIFSADNVYQIRQIGIAVMLIPTLWTLGLIAVLLVPGHGIASRIRIDEAPFTELVVGIIIIVVSWIMDVGRELREEQDLVV